jgi:exonuclease SbcD
MRFLHTADWHVGKTLLGRSRLDEQEQVAAEIVDIARRERIDCVLLAGDVFDSTAPTADAQRVVCDALAEIAGAGIAAVIVGGNHDHQRIASLRKLAGRLKIVIRPGSGENEQGGVFTLDRNGEKAKIAMLPWIPEHRVMDASEMEQPKDAWSRMYSAYVADRCKRAASAFASNTINILVAHLFVLGAEVGGSERPAHIAGPFAVPPELLPRAHYIALGHIHKPQEIAMHSPCFYSGSPLQLDFGERGQEKRVVVVEAHAGQQATIVSVPLASGHRLREVVTTIDQLTAARDANGDFLRVVVKSDTKIHSLPQRVAAVLPNAVIVQQEYTQAAPEHRPTLAWQNPRERFRQFVREHKHTAVSEATMEAFDRLYDEARNETGEA